MNTILVPIDFSATSEVALNYAFYLAKQLNFKLELLHVRDLPEFERFIVEEEVSVEKQEKLLAKFEAFVEKKMKSQLEEYAAIDVQYTLKEGDATPTIIKTIKARNPILVVMGAKGNGANHLLDLWIGGTTKRVVKKVKTPILVIPEKVQFKPIEKIAFASDYTKEDAKTIVSLLNVSKSLQAQLEVLHIKDKSVAVQSSKSEELKNTLESSLNNGMLSFKEIDGPLISETMNDYASTNNVSMLAVMDEEDTLFERIFNFDVSYKLAASAEIPTLIFSE